MKLNNEDALTFTKFYFFPIPLILMSMFLMKIILKPFQAKDNNESTNVAEVKVVANQFSSNTFLIR